MSFITSRKRSLSTNSCIRPESIEQKKQKQLLGNGSPGCSERVLDGAMQPENGNSIQQESYGAKEERLFCRAIAIAFPRLAKGRNLLHNYRPVMWFGRATNVKLYKALDKLYNLSDILDRNPGLRHWLRHGVGSYTPAQEKNVSGICAAVEKFTNAAHLHLEHPEDVWTAHKREIVPDETIFGDRFPNYDPQLFQTTEEDEQDYTSYNAPCYCQQSEIKHEFRGPCWCTVQPEDSKRSVVHSNTPWKILEG